MVRVKGSHQPYDMTMFNTATTSERVISQPRKSLMNKNVRAARKSAPQRTMVGAKVKRTRISKTQREANVRRKFTTEDLQMTTPLYHCMETIDMYMKHHLCNAEPLYLRTLLRTLHQLLPSNKGGAHKRLIRGLLQFFTRWSIEKIWLKISELFEIISVDLGIETFETHKEFPIMRIVSPILVARTIAKMTNKTNLKIMNEKIQRLNPKNSRIITSNESIGN